MVEEEEYAAYRKGAVVSGIAAERIASLIKDTTRPQFSHEKYEEEQVAPQLNETLDTIVHNPTTIYETINTTKPFLPQSTIEWALVATLSLALYMHSEKIEQGADSLLKPITKAYQESKEYQRQQKEFGNIHTNYNLLV